MDGYDDFTPAQWEIIGELCRLQAAAVRDGRSPTAPEAARVFRMLREAEGDYAMDVLGHRAFLQQAAGPGGNGLACDVLELLEPWWSDGAEPEPPVNGRSRH